MANKMTNNIIRYTEAPVLDKNKIAFREASLYKNTT